MNTAKRFNIITFTVFLCINLLLGCGGKDIGQTVGGSPQISVYFLGVDTSRLNSDEAELFNKMAIEMTNNLVKDINI